MRQVTISVISYRWVHKKLEISDYNIRRYVSRRYAASIYLVKSKKKREKNISFASYQEIYLENS